MPANSVYWYIFIFSWMYQKLTMSIFNKGCYLNFNIKGVSRPAIFWRSSIIKTHATVCAGFKPFITFMQQICLIWFSFCVWCHRSAFKTWWLKWKDCPIRNLLASIHCDNRLKFKKILNCLLSNLTMVLFSHWYGHWQLKYLSLIRREYSWFLDSFVGCNY